MNQDGIKRQHETARYDFVIVELDLGITFCEIALTAVDPEKCERNEENARRAQFSAKHFLRNVRFSGRMGQEIDERLTRLAELLRQIERGRILRLA